MLDGRLSMLTIVNIGEEFDPMHSSVWTPYEEVITSEGAYSFNEHIGNQQAWDSKAILTAFNLNPPFHNLAFEDFSH